MSFQNLVGQTFGQYELQSLLGAGGMGAVYRASQRSLKRLVAIKVLVPAVAEQPGYLERFNREAEVSASLEHKHIVPVYDYGVQDNNTYIVMRLLTGGSLAQRMQQAAEAGRSLPTLYETSNLLKQLASALDYAHMRGIIHRDIKPGNVMFDNLGDAYLVDFGIAKLLDSMTDLTGGAGIGTPSYMPPEQWRSEDLTPMADQYALAVAIYNMLTGHMPFDAETPFQMMHKHLNEEPTPLRAHRGDLPGAVELVLERALRKTPRERFPTVTAFAQAFDAAIEGAPAETTGFFDFQLAGIPVAGGGTPAISRPAPSQAPSAESARTPAPIPVAATGGSGEGTPPPPRTAQPSGMAASASQPPARTATPPATGASVPPPPTTGRPAAPPPRRGGIPWLPLIVILVLLLVGVGLIVSQINQSGNQPTPTAVVAAATQPTKVESTEESAPTRQALVVNTPGSATATPVPSATPTLAAATTEAGPASNTPQPEPSSTTESVAVAALNQPSETPVEPTGTSTNTVTPSPEPTDTAEPTATSTLTPSPEPTDTAEPTTTPTHTVTPSPEPTDTPEPTATNTVTPSPEPTDTATTPPTLAPTLTKQAPHTATPEPTATEAPQEIAALPASFGSEVAITFEDDFDADEILPDWDVWNNAPSLSDGVLSFEGQETWEDGLARTGIDRNEGVLVLFQHDDALRMEFNLQHGSYDDDTWRNWTFARWDTWEAAAYSGPEGVNYVSYGFPYLESNTWYYLLMRIGGDGTFYTQVWERDNPEYYLINVAQQPEGDWAFDDWEFVAHLYDGSLNLDLYQELSFPPGYETPWTPPNLDGVLVGNVAQATEAALSTQAAIERPDVLAFCNELGDDAAPPAIAAGQMIDVYWYWYVSSPELLQQHIDNAVYEVAVDGQLLDSWQLYKEPEFRVQDGEYYQYWSVPFGPLAEGEHRIDIHLTWSALVSDGYSEYGPGSDTPEWSSGCTFTVE